MRVKSKFNARGVSRDKVYDVIEVLDYINSYRIMLDDGTIAVRHKCGFEVINN